VLGGTLYLSHSLRNTIQCSWWCKSTN